MDNNVYIVTSAATGDQLIIDAANDAPTILALLDELPGGGTDTHAVEMAVTRLRSALGDSKMIQTVVKRGYRLAVDLEYDENDSDDA